jgi:hypothetical protein
MFMRMSQVEDPSVTGSEAFEEAKEMYAEMASS